MSPTFFRYKNLRFYVNSREERRKHIHVQSPDGEVKVWLEPDIQLARNYGVKESQLKEILTIVGEKKHELNELWDKHFKL
ncbi:MAG: DUF4160 domain-containing protein [bacterium]